MNKRMIRVDDLVIDLETVYAIKKNKIKSTIEFYTDKSTMFDIYYESNLLDEIFENLTQCLDNIDVELKIGNKGDKIKWRLNKKN